MFVKIKMPEDYIVAENLDLAWSNFATIGCNTGVTEQKMQHFTSNSPWSAWAVIEQVQAEIAAIPGLGQGGVHILDESADKKAMPSR